MVTGAAVKIRMVEAALCSGFGQWHSQNNKKNPRDYVTVSLPEIQDMMAYPPSEAKEDAQWVIFSTLPSRVHAEQREQGQFYALWADIDETDGMHFDELIDHLNGCLLDFMVYTSRSATEEKPKARIIVPLAEPVVGSQFVMLQKILNDKLQAEGITPDRATERAGQVCYLPNRGEFYKYHVESTVGPMHADAWGHEERTEIEREKAADTARKERMEQARAKARQRVQTGCKSHIDAYNTEYDLEMVLEQYGYIKRGARWLSPNSSSGAAGVTIKDSKWLSAHGSDAGIGQQAGAGWWGDAFDLFVHYEHHGDRNSAIKAAAEMFGLNREQAPPPEEPPPWVNEEIPPFEDTACHNEIKNECKPQGYDEKNDCFTCPLDSFAMNGLAGEMETQMLEDKFVLDRMAILGQSTAFYAKPNAGKTLFTIWLLMQAIKRGEVNGDDIFYVNADDTHKGLVYKLKLAEKHGFKMLAPGYKGFKSDQLPIHLEKMVSSGSAKNKIIILDTVKKFTDLMSKSKVSAFSEGVRKFVSHGGTAIMLAHVNKHRDGENKVIYSGTADLVDDADCAYTLDVVLDDPETGMRTVRFENFKARGDVAHETFYRYDFQDGTPYYDRLDSVALVDADERKAAEKQKRLDNLLEKNRPAVNAITECLGEGIVLKTALINEACDRSGLSKKQITKALLDHTGTKASENQLWTLKIGERNAHSYELNYGSFS